MRNRRRERYEDRRPHWSDPDLPVFREEKCIDTYTGRVVWTRMIQLTPEQENQRAQNSLWQGDLQGVPDWHNDPSYNWARRRR